ncbi:MAG: sigma-54 dependent transcriptional regulator [Desulfovibrionaceae bacterium]|nr:sigma-54 dependent transcriptional regulator [Desulfovibrionaceae bacterium]
MAKILIIDDDEQIRQVCRLVFEGMEHEVHTAPTLGRGIAAVKEGDFDVVYLDVDLPDGIGLNAVSSITEGERAPEVIIFTGASYPNGAELAIQNGAWDYIEKPATEDVMTLPLIRALQYRKEKFSHHAPTVALKRDRIIGHSPVIAKCLDLIAQAANSEANTLITGETGTGKELFARAIHENSPRADGPFVVVDCSILTETLIESVLFGHAKGAFTGAEKKSEGLIRQAHGGILFLDEVGELPFAMQKAFLRVLQERRFRPVGAKEEESSDFRLVAATNKDLPAMAAEGRFRSDLLFRLHTMHIAIPALRERDEDIRELTLYYTHFFCRKYNVPLKGFSPEFFDFMLEYDWPGNVRELVNTVENIVVRARLDPTLYPKHLPSEIRIRGMGGGRKNGQGNGQGALATPGEIGDAEIGGAASVGQEPGEQVELLIPFDDYKRQTERNYFQAVMASCQGDIRQACDLSKLGKQSLYRYLRIHGISTR